METLFLIGRILFGGFFLMSGWKHLSKLGGMSAYAASKNVPAPKFLVIVSGLMILLGGLSVILGVFVTYGLYLIALFLIVTSFKMHNFWKSIDPGDRMVQMTNFMKNMALFGAALAMLAIAQPWPYALF
jgi:uncharacterized membrane protein YphA (DoxX/SURF4 family)